MGTTVGEVSRCAATALGLDVREFLEQVVRFVMPDAGGDSDPGRETILGYEVLPRTRCGYKFAAMVLDLLHAQRGAINNPQELARAIRACRNALQETRKIRFVQPARTNAASIRRITRIGGAYVLARRRVSGVQSVRQELLVLSHEGRGEAQTFATYITPDVVCRGTWCVIQQNVCCMMQGFRSGYVRRDVVNLQLLYEEPDPNAPVLLSGFITGITSHVLRPVVLPVFAMRVPDQNLSEKFMQIGDGCDAELSAAWSKVASYNQARIQRLGEIFDKVMVAEQSAIVMNYGDISNKVLQTFGSVDKLADRRVMSFCREYSLDAAWT